MSFDEARETPRSSRAERLWSKPAADTPRGCLATRGNGGSLALVVGGGAGPGVAWRGGAAETGGGSRVLAAGGCRDWKLGSRGCSRDWRQLTRSRGSERRALDDGLASRPVQDSSRRAHRLSRFREHAGCRSGRRFRLSRRVETSAPELACEGGSPFAPNERLQSARKLQEKREGRASHNRKRSDSKKDSYARSWGSSSPAVTPGRQQG